MTDVSVRVDATNLMLHLDQLPLKLRSALRPTVAKLTDELLAHVHSAEPRRTGRLQAETRRFIDETENYIRGRVRVLGVGGRGHNVAAAALEYGAHSSFQVRSYQRRGGPVSGYRRRANIAARRFVHGPAEAMRARALVELQAAIDRALKQP